MTEGWPGRYRPVDLDLTWRADGRGFLHTNV